MTCVLGPFVVFGEEQRVSFDDVSILTVARSTTDSLTRSFAINLLDLFSDVFTAQANV